MSNDAEKLIAELVLTVNSLTAEVARLRDVVMGQPTHAEGWMRTNEAAAALRSEGVRSAKHLRRLLSEGAFTEGREVRNISRGDRPTWEYHIPSCRKALQRHFKRIAG